MVAFAARGVVKSRKEGSRTHARRITLPTNNHGTQITQYVDGFNNVGACLLMTKGSTHAPRGDVSIKLASHLVTESKNLEKKIIEHYKPK